MYVPQHVEYLEENTASNRWVGLQTKASDHTPIARLGVDMSVFLFPSVLSRLYFIEHQMRNSVRTKHSSDSHRAAGSKKQHVTPDMGLVRWADSPS